MIYDTSRKMAEAHTDWFLSMIRPILIEHMVHGYKHGYEDGSKTRQKHEK